MDDQQTWKHVQNSWWLEKPNIKTKLRFYLTLVSIVIIKNKQVTRNDGENVAKWESTFPAGPAAVYISVEGLQRTFCVCMSHG